MFALFRNIDWSASLGRRSVARVARHEGVGFSAFERLKPFKRFKRFKRFKS